MEIVVVDGDDNSSVVVAAAYFEEVQSCTDQHFPQVLPVGCGRKPLMLVKAADEWGVHLAQLGVAIPGQHWVKALVDLLEFVTAEKPN